MYEIKFIFRLQVQVAASRTVLKQLARIALRELRNELNQRFAFEKHERSRRRVGHGDDSRRRDEGAWGGEADFVVHFPPYVIPLLPHARA